MLDVSLLEKHKSLFVLELLKYNAIFKSVFQSGNNTKCCEFLGFLLYRGPFLLKYKNVRKVQRALHINLISSTVL